MGYRTPDSIIVTIAIPLQTAERKFKEVIYPRKFEECKELVGGLPFPRLDVVGVFHSHPNWGKKRFDPRPGSHDEDATEEQEVMVIVSIDKRNRQADISSRRNPYQITVSHGEYYMRLRGYFKLGDKMRRMALDTQVFSGLV